jgi:hypothetical protein
MHRPAANGTSVLLAFLMVDCLRDGFARFLDSPLSQKSTGEHRNANACAAT